MPLCPGCYGTTGPPVFHNMVPNLDQILESNILTKGLTKILETIEFDFFTKSLTKIILSFFFVTKSLQ